MKPYTLADRLAMTPPAEVREELPLFVYADTLRGMEAAVLAAEERAAAADRVLRETMEYRDHEAARERLSDAKREAVERDATVAAEREGVNVAKGALKHGAGGVVKANRDAKKALKAARAALRDYQGEVIGAVKRAGRGS